METKTYFVREFDIVELPKGSLLLAPAASIHIQDQVIIAKLRKLQEARLSYITPHRENNSLGPMIFEKEFLYFITNETKILLDVTEICGENAKFQKVQIYTDWKGDHSLWLEQLHRGGVTNITIKTAREFQDHIDPDTIEKNCLFVTLDINYSDNNIHQLYKLLDSNGKNGALTSYFFGNQFWIDGLFLKNSGLPSHFSHIAKWDHLERSQAGISTGWPRLLDFFKNNKTKYQNTHKPTEMEINIAAFHLINKTIELAGAPDYSPHLEDLLSAIRVNIKTAGATREVVTDWPHDPYRSR